MTDAMVRPGSTRTDAAATCPACEGAAQRFFRLDGVPVLCNALAPNPQAARQCARGPLDLAVCASCGLVFNAAFDEALVPYDTDYENALHFSSAFREYNEQAAQRLIDQHQLRGKRIVEIGCGDGYFLRRLCELGHNAGTGYDPALAEESETRLDGGGTMRLIPGTLPTHEPITADLVCCRHVLEHLPEPVQMLEGLRKQIERPDTVVFFEVPNGEWVLDEHRLWDVIYEHCSYFTPDALRRVFTAAGFAPIASDVHFGAQFATIEARPAPQAPGDSAAPMPSRRDLARCEAFAAACRERLERLRGRVAQAADDRQTVLAWGAGSKGVMALNLVDPHASAIAAIVDLNPRKRGHFVAGTGHAIIGPDQLDAARPDVVLVMNGLYQDEIRASLDSFGLSPELFVV